MFPKRSWPKQNKPKRGEKGEEWCQCASDTNRTEAIFRNANTHQRCPTVASELSCSHPNLILSMRNQRQWWHDSSDWKTDAHIVWWMMFCPCPVHRWLEFCTNAHASPATPTCLVSAMKSKIEIRIFDNWKVFRISGGGGTMRIGSQ